jgi:hypothetical protein
MHPSKWADFRAQWRAVDDNGRNLTPDPGFLNGVAHGHGYDMSDAK